MKFSQDYQSYKRSEWLQMAYLGHFPQLISVKGELGRAIGNIAQRVEQMFVVYISQTFIYFTVHM